MNVRPLFVAMLLASASTMKAQASSAVVPLTPGLVVVSAVLGDAHRGDYEQFVSLTRNSEQGMGLMTYAQVRDGAATRTVSATRSVSRADLQHGTVQILGFVDTDASEFPGTTSLGPSLDVLQALRTTGRAAYGVKNYANRQTSSGTITRVEPGTVPFSVLVNGKRTTVPAIHAAGLLRYSDGARPWDLYVLDDPLNPLLLRVTYGAIGGGLPVRSEWTRQVVRIDLPAAQPVEEALRSECRVEATGVYFEFNSASLTPQSDPAIKSIADLMRRRADWRIAIEGHTDDVGGDRDNAELSERRAAAVRDAVVRQIPTAASRLTTSGFGKSRPRETNATPEGRARNRRVELVRACGAKQG